MEEEATLMMATTEKKQEAPSSWKLYDNPHFSSISDHHHHHHHHHPYYHNKKSKSRSSLHSRNFSDFFRAMDREPNLSDLDNAIALIKELRAELDSERRMRKKADLLNRTLAREAEEETRRRKAAEEACAKLAEEIARVREDAERRVREAEEERRMMRTAEAWREERMQMKLAEARLALEDKCYLLNKQETETASKKTKVEENKKENGKVDDCFSQIRKEIENPHIKRGIKGGLEFPKAVRVRGSGGNGSSPNSTAHSQGQRGGGGGLGSNLECQRAQLRVLLRHHRNPAASVIIGPPHSLVM